MKNKIIQCAALTALLLVSCNPDQFGTMISRVAAISLSIIVAILIPNSSTIRPGRYMASVTVAEYGQARELWAQNYRFHFIAQLMARRAALRYDFLGDAFDSTDIAWHVADLSPLHQRIESTLIFRKA